MWLKHGIWCQCILVGHSILAVACLMSMQNMTLALDVYWSVVFSVVALLQWIAVEHGSTFDIEPVVWQTVSAHVDRFIPILLSAWSIQTWTATTMPVVAILSAAMTCVPIHPMTSFALSFLVKTAFEPDVLIVLWIVNGALRWYKQQSRLKMLHTSLAGAPIRHFYGSKALIHFVDALLMWVIRCEHRFPHTIRWSQPCCAVVAIGCAIAYCHSHVAQTRVTRNVIIQSVGHTIAASLNAAEACPTCSKYLSALDMESSFGD